MCVNACLCGRYLCGVRQAAAAWYMHALPVGSCQHLPFLSVPPFIRAALLQAILHAAGQPPVHFTARFLMPSQYYAYLTAFVGTLMYTLANSAFGRWLLLK